MRDTCAVCGGGLTSRSIPKRARMRGDSLSPSETPLARVKNSSAPLRKSPDTNSFCLTLFSVRHVCLPVLLPLSLGHADAKQLETAARINLDLHGRAIRADNEYVTRIRERYINHARRAQIALREVRKCIGYRISFAYLCPSLSLDIFFLSSAIFSRALGVAHGVCFLSRVSSPTVGRSFRKWRL